MKNKLFQFLLVLFSISLIFASCFYFLGGEYNSLGGTLFAAAYMFIPMISVLIVQFLQKEPLLKGLGTSFRINKWFFIGWLLMPMFNLLALFCSPIIPGTSFSTETPLLANAIEELSKNIPNVNAWLVMAITFVSGLWAGITINAVFAYGEEIAWRGWLLRQCSGMSFIKVSLLIGFIWGLWHFPVILMGHNYPEHPVLGVFVMIAFCIVATPLFMYVRIKSQSVIAAAIMHGTLNATAGLSLMYLLHEHTWGSIIAGPCGLVGIAILLCIDLAIFVFDKDVAIGIIENK